MCVGSTNASCQPQAFYGNYVPLCAYNEMAAHEMVTLDISTKVAVLAKAWCYEKADRILVLHHELKGTRWPKAPWNHVSRETVLLVAASRTLLAQTSVPA